jgi:hypothetical protein
MRIRAYAFIACLILIPFGASAQADYFVQGIAAELAPWIPYDAFFGECPRMVHHDSVTYFVYTASNSSLYIRTYDHRTRALSQPSHFGDSWNDHVRPALLLDADNYFHIFYAARPSPARYLRSAAPLEWIDWSGADSDWIGTSATYPVPIIIGGRALFIYREGNSYSASMSLAAKDVAPPAGTWSVTTLVNTSTVFVPMPLAAFEREGDACFLFNMRDALLSSPHTTVAPSVREGLSVICTQDGSTFTDIDGIPLDVPLDYTGDRDGFPVVLEPEIFGRIDIRPISNYTFPLVPLSLDGSFVDIEVTKQTYSQTQLSFGDGSVAYAAVLFTAGGDVQVSNGMQYNPIDTYESGVPFRMRLKLHFSARLTRTWMDGVLEGDPKAFIPPAGGFPEPIVIDTLTVASDEGIELHVVTGREYKLITASACIDAEGVPNYFFIDRQDSSHESYWALMHSRDGIVREIGNTNYHKYHPTCLLAGTQLLVVVAYFEGEGLFLLNNHLHPSSELYLLTSGDGIDWNETRLTDGPTGQVHPIFKRSDGSGIVELSWTGMENSSLAYLKHGYFTELDTTYSDLPDMPGLIHAYPNPCNEGTTLILQLGDDASVTITVYDSGGRVVRRILKNEFMQAGFREIPWACTDKRGEPVASGIYFARAKCGGAEHSCKIVIIR